VVLKKQQGELVKLSLLFLLQKHASFLDVDCPARISYGTNINKEARHVNGMRK